MGWLGLQNIPEVRISLLFALGIEAEVLLPFAKDCSGKPDPYGNALILFVEMRISV